MEPEERRQLPRVVRDEARTVSATGSSAGSRSRSPHLGERWLLTECAAPTCSRCSARAVDRDGTVEIAWERPVDTLWVKADSHAVGQLVVHLTDRLHQELGVDSLALAATELGHYVQLEMRWKSGGPEPEIFQEWLDQPMAGGLAPSARTVIERHGGEIWCEGTPRRPRLGENPAAAGGRHGWVCVETGGQYGESENCGQ